MLIKDLSKELDTKAMTAVRGGDNGNSATNVDRPGDEPVRARRRRVVRPVEHQRSCQRHAEGVDLEQPVRWRFLLRPDPVLRLTNFDHPPFTLGELQCLSKTSAKNSTPRP